MGHAEPQRRNFAARAAIAFGRFWWNFLVGDTPELFVGAVAILAGAAAVIAAADRPAAWVATPIALVVLLGLSLRREARRSARAR